METFFSRLTVTTRTRNTIFSLFSYLTLLKSSITFPDYLKLLKMFLFFIFLESIFRIISHLSDYSNWLYQELVRSNLHAPFCHLKYFSLAYTILHNTILSFQDILVLFTKVRFWKFFFPCVSDLSTCSNPDQVPYHLHFKYRWGLKVYFHLCCTRSSMSRMLMPSTCLFVLTTFICLLFRDQLCKAFPKASSFGQFSSSLLSFVCH